MKDKNKYDFYSGAYVFDLMDRFALETLNQEHPETRKQLWFTWKVDSFLFAKQLCDTTGIELAQVHEKTFLETYVFWVWLEQNGVEIASCRIEFKQAQHNWCKTTRGRKNGKGKK